MLRMEAVDVDSPRLAAVDALMTRAFPANERMPMALLLPSGRSGAELFALLDGETFCGFISLLSWQDVTHILFFAIDEGLRGRGLGSEALQLMCRAKQGQRVIADLEACDDRAPNAEQRRKRRRFYERGGFAPTEIAYRWRGERYVVLSHGGRVTTDEFDQFWDHFDT